MGLMDDISKAADKVEDLAAEHKGQVRDGLAKAADAIEKKVGHGDVVNKAEDAAKGLVDKLKKD